jgi:hypothetical protein
MGDSPLFPNMVTRVGALERSHLHLYTRAGVGVAPHVVVRSRLNVTRN